MALGAREKYRQSFTVPAASGSYAFERITFVAVQAGMPEEAFLGVTAAVETVVADSVVELWLPRLMDSTTSPNEYVDGDYKYSGQSFTSTAAIPGAETWTLAKYPGAQIRVKSGGTSGSAVIGASAW